MPTQKTPEEKNFGWSVKSFDKRKPKNSQDEKAAEPDVNEVIRVKTDLVITDVLVTDQAGNVVSGLTKADFSVMEDDQPERIEFFARGENSQIPRSILLILDSSPTERPYIKTSTEAAKILIDKLRPNDKMALITGDMEILTDFTSDKSILKAKLSGLPNRPFGKSRFMEFETLVASLNELFDDNSRQQIVIFQSDGLHALWLKDDKDAPYPFSNSLRMISGMQYSGRDRSMSKLGFSDVKNAIENSPATIYSVIPGLRFFGLSERERKARAKLSWQNMLATFGKTNSSVESRRMFEDREERTRTGGQAAAFRVAELSGGNTAMIETPEGADSAYNAILASINDRYVLGYYLGESPEGEKERNIRVKVLGHPEYVVTSRKSYVTRNDK